MLCALTLVAVAAPTAYLGQASDGFGSALAGGAPWFLTLHKGLGTMVDNGLSLASSSLGPFVCSAPRSILGILLDAPGRSFVPCLGASLEGVKNS